MDDVVNGNDSGNGGLGCYVGYGNGCSVECSLMYIIVLFFVGDLFGCIFVVCVSVEDVVDDYDDFGVDVYDDYYSDDSDGDGFVFFVCIWVLVVCCSNVVCVIFLVNLMCFWCSFNV